MQAQTVTATPPGWQGAPEVTVLADIFEDDVQVAVWDRPSPVGQWAGGPVQRRDMAG